MKIKIFRLGYFVGKTIPAKSDSANESDLTKQARDSYLRGDSEKLHDHIKNAVKLSQTCTSCEASKYKRAPLSNFEYLLDLVILYSIPVEKSLEDTSSNNKYEEKREKRSSNPKINIATGRAKVLRNVYEKLFESSRVVSRSVKFIISTFYLILYFFYQYFKCSK
jgi:hypothetical protein